MQKPTANQTAAPMEFVADQRDIGQRMPHLRTVDDPNVAAVGILGEADDRVSKVLERCPGSPIVLLSGGVDSIFVAATLAARGVQAHAVTVVTDKHAADIEPAQAAAAALGMRHTVITLDAEALKRLSLATIEALGIPEPWEVAAAMPLIAARPVIERHQEDESGQAAVFTGSGADAIFAGGRALKTLDHNSIAARDELDSLARSETGKNFVQDRLVPDFYERALGVNADRLIHVFQTARFWQLAEQLAPNALYGPPSAGSPDKYALRLACCSILPTDAQYLAWNRKIAIQESSGIFEGLLAASRAYAGELPGARAYSDPDTEPLEVLAVRLWLSVVR